LLLPEVWDACRTLRIHAGHDIDGRSLKQLAGAAGYKDSSGVTRLFRRVHGMTPSEAFENGLELSLRKVEGLLHDVLGITHGTDSSPG
jgi:AraC-like DNA-binding protein